ncbi:MAG: bis(5'-nucleosyl)-tetraphosphatase (symmetrical) YqeK [Clostridia bacterium]
MKRILARMIDGICFTNCIEKDSYSLFVQHGHEDTAKHCIKVANEAKRLAEMFGLDAKSALASGFLHDIGEIIPANTMAEAASELRIEVCKEELVFPGILHQKISRVIADQVFGVKDSEVLNAIECHTTLWSNPEPLDMVLF